ncbi:MAG: nucleotidyltransferase substrate binding protein [Chitinophagales bacterium]
MDKHKDIRWEQRFSNFNKAMSKLDRAVTHIKSEYYSEGSFNEDLFEEGDDIIREGLIQRFEYTHELAWNVMKDFIKDHGNAEIFGSKDATREAFSLGLISNGKVWMEMIKSRNKTSHTYNEEIANEIFINILDKYHKAFLDFQKLMEDKRSGEQGKIFE